MAGFNRIDSERGAGSRLGVGVVGYGFMGKVHSNAWLKIPYSFATPAAVPRLHALCGRTMVLLRLADYRRKIEQHKRMSQIPPIGRFAHASVTSICSLNSS